MKFQYNLRASISLSHYNLQALIKQKNKVKLLFKKVYFFGLNYLYSDICKYKVANIIYTFD